MANLSLEEVSLQRRMMGKTTPSPPRSLSHFQLCVGEHARPLKRRAHGVATAKRNTDERPVSRLAVLLPQEMKTIPTKGKLLDELERKGHFKELSFLPPDPLDKLDEAVRCTFPQVTTFHFCGRDLKQLADRSTRRVHIQDSPAPASGQAQRLLAMHVGAPPPSRCRTPAHPTCLQPNKNL